VNTTTTTEKARKQEQKLCLETPYECRMLGWGVMPQRRYTLIADLLVHDWRLLSNEK
jgi:hypothetical protein